MSHFTNITPHFRPSFAKSAAWVVFSTATILFMPVMIETERLQLQDAQKAQKNQILLGPGSHFNSVILECVLGVFQLISFTHQVWHSLEDPPLDHPPSNPLLNLLQCLSKFILLGVTLELP